MEFIFGKLTLDALPHEWFTVGGTVAMTAMVAGVAFYITRIKRWKWLWSEWITSVDPKKIGIMYMRVALLMLVRGGMDVGVIWLQQAVASGSQGFLSAQHVQEVYTAH